MKSGPDAWGPHAWKFLHYVSLGYSDRPTKEDKEKYKSFFLLLQDVLPCSICREHFKENYSKLPLTDEILSSRNNLVKWVIDLHNVVNEMKNKSTVSYEEAIELMMNNFETSEDEERSNSNNTNSNTNNTFKESSNNNKYDIIIKLVLLLIVIVFMYSLIKNRKIFK